MSLTRNPLLAIVVATIALLAVTVITSPSDTYAGTFAPELDIVLDDTTPETASGYTSMFGIGNTDVNFAAVVAYLPPEWGIIGGNDIPIGATVGSLDAEATLGLINSSCNQVLPVHFDFRNSSIDINDTVIFNDDEADDDETAEFAELDENGEYISVSKYPDFLNRIFTDENDEPLQPVRRSSGVAIVAGIPVLLQFLIFPPGTPIDEDLPSDPEYGWPSVTVLQNAGDPDITPEPGPITDFCSPLTTTNVTLGETAEGDPLFVNPGPGVYTFTTVSFGQRDVDDDGFENSLDTCPYDVNVGSPKITLDGDLDQDRVDAACDPNDDPATGGTDSDIDADGYLNTQDNCPLEPNGEQETNQADEDKDQIGDVCDTDPQVADGELSYSELTVDVTIGDGSGPAAAPDCLTAVGVACVDAGGESPGGNGGTDDDDSSNTGLIVGIAVGVVALIVIVGGGAALMMRRRNGAA